MIAILLMPLYAYWGMPMPLLGFIGNFIFLPILFIFVALSFVFFLGLLFNICFTPIAWLLDFIAFWWIKIMQTFSTTKGTFFFIYNNFYVYLPCWGFVLGVIAYKQRTNNKGIVFLMAFFWFIGAIFFYCFQGKKIDHWTFADRGSITTVHAANGKQYAFIFNGNRKQNKRNEYWYYFSLLPSLAKNQGCDDSNVATYYYKKNERKKTKKN